MNLETTKTVAQLEDELALTVKRMIQKDPFYGLFLMGLKRKFVDDSYVETACVAWVGNDFELWINPKMWDKLDAHMRMGALKHELLHLVFEHLIIASDLMKKNKNLGNIAADMVVNQYIEKQNLFFIKNWKERTQKDIDANPENTRKYWDLSPILIDDWSKKLGIKLPEKESVRTYYSILEEWLKKNGKPNGGNNQSQEGGDDAHDGGDPGICRGGSDGAKFQAPDNHKNWGDRATNKDTLETMQKGLIEQYMKRADEACQSCGDSPAELADILERIKNPAPPRFNWKHYFRNFIGNSTKFHTRSSRSRRNKRCKYFAGFRTQHECTLLVCLDTSGSVSNQMLKEFQEELTWAAKTVDIFVLSCDCQIDSSTVVKYDPKKDLKIYGGGGTCFQPAIDYYNKNLKFYNSLVYFTDGECYAPTGVLKPSSVLWMIPKGGSSQYLKESKENIGQVIEIDAEPTKK